MVKPMMRNNNVCPNNRSRPRRRKVPSSFTALITVLVVYSSCRHSNNVNNNDKSAAAAAGGWCVWAFLSKVQHHRHYHAYHYGKGEKSSVLWKDNNNNENYPKTSNSRQSSSQTRISTSSTEQENEHMKEDIEQMRNEALRRIEALHKTVPTSNETNHVPTNTPSQKVNNNNGVGKSPLLQHKNNGSNSKNGKQRSPTTNGIEQQQQRDKYSLLDGTCWKIMWNIGRTLGEETTMPKTWGISGERLLLSMELEFADEPLLQTSDEFLNGNQGAKVLKVLQNQQGTLGPALHEGSKNFQVENGGWRIAKGEGPLGTDIVRFFVNVPSEVSHIGGDVYCPKGRVYCSCGYFPAGSSRTKESLRQQLEGLGREYEQLSNNPTQKNMWDTIVQNKRLLEIRIESGKLTQRMNEARVREPDNSVLRKSKRGDVGLTREGGVCCRITKGLSTTYPTLGKFGIASIDKKEKPSIHKDDDDVDDVDSRTTETNNYLAP
mmetsp:Transcript_7818/g.11244  ORF Transcript_7818/g.11244 Transcript_7818/m.11244 type:complete len:490 (+) Transcript_7818:214-1683(+)